MNSPLDTPTTTERDRNAPGRLRHRWRVYSLQISPLRRLFNVRETVVYTTLHVSATAHRLNHGYLDATGGCATATREKAKLSLSATLA